MVSAGAFRIMLTVPVDRVCFPSFSKVCPFISIPLSMGYLMDGNWLFRIFSHSNRLQPLVIITKLNALSVAGSLSLKYHPGLFTYPLISDVSRRLDRILSSPG